jgi:SAM-dependent methyltransferase
MKGSRSYSYKPIITHYEDCLEKFGDTSMGVDWPNEKDAKLRYGVMLDLFLKRDQTEVSLLDFGCGTAHMLEYIKDYFPEAGILYTGLDISGKFIEVSRNKFPTERFIEMDILEDNGGPGRFDYIIMNGVFTEKRELGFDEMWNYFCDMMIRIFPYAEKGIAFNVMSKHVDWERDDLFHLSMDRLGNFLSEKISRHFVFRSDYGLYEYTCYVYRMPLS